MWPLLKGELSYNRAYLLAAYLATIGMWVAYVFDPSGMFQLFGIPALFFVFALFTFGVREKRERCHVLLPVPLKHRGFMGMSTFAVLSRRNYELYAVVRDYFFYSPLVAVVATVLCAGLIYASATVYARRHSYLA